MKNRKCVLIYSMVAIMAPFVLAGCSSNSGDQDSGQQEMSSQQGSESASDKQWETLFGGESLEKWRNFKSDGLNPQWQVIDGNMVLTEKGGGSIITKKQYDDFELVLDWKISKGGNSGIFYNVAEHDTLGAVHHTGPEYQLLDNENAHDNQIKTHLAASNYDLQAPSVDACNPAGEWNTTKIVVNGDHVEHWLNGKKVVEYELGSEKWKNMVANSKFNNMPGYGSAEKGHIALQDHGQKIWFRNIKIREL